MNTCATKSLLAYQPLHYCGVGFTEVQFCQHHIFVLCYYRSFMIWEFRIIPIYHILDLGAAPQFIHCWKRAGVRLLTALFSKPSCDWKKKAHPLVSGASVLTAGTVYFKWPIWRICIMQSRIGKKSWEMAYLEQLELLPFQFLYTMSYLYYTLLTFFNRKTTAPVSVNCHRK